MKTFFVCLLALFTVIPFFSYAAVYLDSLNRQDPDTLKDRQFKNNSFYNAQSKGNIWKDSHRKSSNLDWIVNFNKRVSSMDFLKIGSSRGLQMLRTQVSGGQKIQKFHEKTLLDNSIKVRIPTTTTLKSDTLSTGGTANFVMSDGTLLSLSKKGNVCKLRVELRYECLTRVGKEYNNTVLSREVFFSFLSQTIRTLPFKIISATLKSDNLQYYKSKYIVSGSQINHMLFFPENSEDLWELNIQYQPKSEIAAEDVAFRIIHSFFVHTLLKADTLSLNSENITKNFIISEGENGYDTQSGYREKNLTLDTFSLVRADHISFQTRVPSRFNKHLDTLRFSRGVLTLQDGVHERIRVTATPNKCYSKNKRLIHKCLEDASRRHEAQWNIERKNFYEIGQSLRFQKRENISVLMYYPYDKDAGLAKWISFKSYVKLPPQRQYKKYKETVYQDNVIITFQEPKYGYIWHIDIMMSSDQDSFIHNLQKRKEFLSGMHFY